MSSPRRPGAGKPLDTTKGAPSPPPLTRSEIELYRALRERWGSAVAVFESANDDGTMFMSVFRALDRPRPGLTYWSTIGLHLTLNNVHGQDTRVELSAVGPSGVARLEELLVTCSLFVMKQRWVAEPGAVFQSLAADVGVSRHLPHALLVPPTWLEQPEELLPGVGRVRWLLVTPISEGERQLALQEGWEELMHRIGQPGHDPFDPSRPDVAGPESAVARSVVRLISDWSITLQRGYRRRVDAGTLVFTWASSPARTVLVNVWDMGPSSDPESLIAETRATPRPPSAKVFEEAGPPPIVGFASWYPEVVDDREQWALYAYTADQGSYVQAAFISDVADDLDWALAAWRSVRRMGDA